MHTPPIKAASWVVLYDRGPVRVPDLDKTRQDHVMVLFLGRGCVRGDLRLRLNAVEFLL